MRQLALAVAVAATLVAGGDCGSSERPAAPPTVAVRTPMTLTAASPTARFPADRSASANLVTVRVVSIQNPALQGLVLSVGIEVGQRTIDVGRVSPFPADQPGTYVLRLPSDAVRAVRTSSTTIVVTVSPIAAGPVAPGVTLAVDAGLSPA